MHSSRSVSGGPTVFSLDCHTLTKCWLGLRISLWGLASDPTSGLYGPGNITLELWLGPVSYLPLWEMATVCYWGVSFLDGLDVFLVCELFVHCRLGFFLMGCTSVEVFGSLFSGLGFLL